MPYHGIISAVDKNAKTFTIEGRRESRVLKMIDGTLHNQRRDETATIDDFNKDDEVSGSYLKDSDGTLVARTVKIGPVKRKATPTHACRSVSEVRAERRYSYGTEVLRCSGGLRPPILSSAAFTAARKSATKCLYSRSRDSSSGWRRSDDG